MENDREEIQQKIINEIEKILGNDKIKVSLDSYFIDDLDMCSLEIMELVSNIEEVFNIRILESNLKSIITVSDLVDLVITKS